MALTDEEIVFVQYDWIEEAGIRVYVGDIQDNADEKAIQHQIYAISMGWA